MGGAQGINWIRLVRDFGIAFHEEGFVLGTLMVFGSCAVRNMEVYGCFCQKFYKVFSCLGVWQQSK